MLPPKKVESNSKEKMKQMRLPFAPIQKENAILKQKEEQEKEREKIAQEKQKKLETEKRALEEKTIREREEKMEKEENKDDVKEQVEKKRKYLEPSTQITPPNKKANIELETTKNNLLSPQTSLGERADNVYECEVTATQLTPKQAKIIEKEERTRLREEAQKAKELEKKQRQEEKERERKEREAERERLRKEKEEEAKIEKEERIRLREEAQKAKELEKQQRQVEKEKERKEREAEREKIKREKEEEKERMENIEKEKQSKLAKVFENFFIKKPIEEQEVDNKGGNGNSKSKCHYQIYGSHALNCDRFCEGSHTMIQNNHLSQFRIKKNMRLAPVSRAIIAETNRSQLDHILDYSQWEGTQNLYLNVLRSQNYIPSKTGKTWPAHDMSNTQKVNECGDDEDTPVTEEDEEEEQTASILQLDEDTTVEIDIPPDAGDLKSLAAGRQIKVNEFCKIKAKLFQFYENERPPYWGTWSKTSDVIGPRRPFAKDNHFLDYGYDSDDDWEEEEQGESLSDEEKDKEEDDELQDEDDDDGFFVGHGILDKDEAHLIDSDKEEENNSDNCKTANSAIISRSKLEEDLEMQKMKIRAEQFEEEYKRKKRIQPKLKPRVFGCFWKNSYNNNNRLSEYCNKQKIVHDQLLKILLPYSYVLHVDGNENERDDEENSPIATSHSTTFRVKQSPGCDNLATPRVGENLETPNLLNSKKTPGRTKMKVFPEEALPDLIRLVHANPYRKKFIAKEFSAFLQKGDTATALKQSDKDNQSPPSNTGETNEHEEDIKDFGVPKTKIIAKIQEIAEYKKWIEPGRMANRMCWIVKPEVLSDSKWNIQEKNIFDCEGSNSWKYILEQPKNAGSGRPASTPDVGDKENCIKSTSASPTNTPKRKMDESLNDRLFDKAVKSPAPNSLITKFAKVLTPEDRLKQMTKLKEKAAAEREANNIKSQEKIAAITKELVEENSLFCIGDLVWGAMKGFPAWPGKIVVPPDDLKRPNAKKLLHCVQFFGTHDFGWLMEQDVKPYDKFRDGLIGGSKTLSFQRAIKEIENYVLGKNVISCIKEPASPNVAVEVCSAFNCESSQNDTNPNENNAEEVDLGGVC